MDTKWYKIPEFNEDVRLERCTYLNNNALAIELITRENEPWCSLTVNLGHPIQNERRAFLDTNNFPDAEKFVTENNIAKPLGCYGRSGFCTYPLYEFLDE